jgi:hypothetical protein
LNVTSENSFDDWGLASGVETTLRYLMRTCATPLLARATKPAQKLMITSYALH